MKYFFYSQIEKTAEGYFIPVPFNVWEVSKYREIIQGEIILDKSPLSCQLLPQGKGAYKIQLTNEAAEHFDMEKEHEILLHIGGSLIKMEQGSPYSLETPIRKIDSMSVIVQAADGLCGQACVAMLAGLTIEEVMKVMDCREWQATMGRMISALNYYGIAHEEVIVFTEGRAAELPKCCIMMEKLGRFCHYLVYYNGLYYDPNLGIIDEYDMSKLQGYLEVKT